VEIATSAIQLNQTCQLLFVRRSQWNLLLSRIEDAMRDALAAATLQPANGLGQLCLAEIYLHLEKIPEGVHFACQALLWNARLPRAHTILMQAISLAVASPHSLSIRELLCNSANSSIYELSSHPNTMEEPRSLFCNEEASDCECQLCFNVFLDPITTPCGHSFCRGCLVKSIETSGRCPYCRFSLSRQRYYHKKTFDRVLAITSAMLALVPLFLFLRNPHQQTNNKKFAGSSP